MTKQSDGFRVLWLLTRELDATGAAIRAEQARVAVVETIDLRVERDDARVVAAIEAADRLVSW